LALKGLTPKTTPAKADLEVWQTLAKSAKKKITVSVHKKIITFLLSYAVVCHISDPEFISLSL